MFDLRHPTVTESLFSPIKKFNHPPVVTITYVRGSKKATRTKQLDPRRKVSKLRS